MKFLSLIIFKLGIFDVFFSLLIYLNLIFELDILRNKLNFLNIILLSGPTTQRQRNSSLLFTTLHQREMKSKNLSSNLLSAFRNDYNETFISDANLAQCMDALSVGEMVSDKISLKYNLLIIIFYFLFFFFTLLRTYFIYNTS